MDGYSILAFWAFILGVMAFYNLTSEAQRSRWSHALAMWVCLLGTAAMIWESAIELFRRLLE